VWVIASGLESYKINEMQGTTAKSLGVWKCLCKNYRCTESQYRSTLCLNSYNVTVVKFHHLPGGLQLFCNINRNLLIKLIAWRLCEFRKCFLYFLLVTENQTFSGDLEFCGSVCLCLWDAECPRHLLPPTQTERARGISQHLAVSTMRNALSTASNLGCLRPLVYSNTRVRDLLFSLRNRC